MDLRPKRGNMSNSIPIYGRIHNSSLVPGLVKIYLNRTCEILIKKSGIFVTLFNIPLQCNYIFADDQPATSLTPRLNKMRVMMNFSFSRYVALLKIIMCKDSSHFSNFL